MRSTHGWRVDGADSHGIPVAPADHWDVSVLVAVVSAGKKPIGSRTGMKRTQQTCPFFPAWVEGGPSDLAEARRAVLSRDLERLGRVMEWSTLKMHSTMLTTEPSIRYWRPGTLAAVQAVEDLRRSGVGAWYTMDAGPNVKVLCESKDAPTVARALALNCDRVETLRVGADAWVEPE